MGIGAEGGLREACRELRTEAQGVACRGTPEEGACRGRVVGEEVCLSYGSYPFAEEIPSVRRSLTEEAGGQVESLKGECERVAYLDGWSWVGDIGLLALSSSVPRYEAEQE